MYLFNKSQNLGDFGCLFWVESIQKVDDRTLIRFSTIEMDSSHILC